MRLARTASIAMYGASILTSSALPGCHERSAGPVAAAAPSASQGPASAVTRWMPVQRADEAPVEEQPARALPSPDAVAVVTPALPARVDRLLVSAGDTVTSGQELARVTMPEAAMAEAVRGSAGTLVKALEQRRGQLTALRAEGLARSSDLFGVEVDLARTRADQARAAATLGALGPGAHGSLRSPIDGVIVEVRAVTGEWWRPESGPLLRVAAPRARRVEATLGAAPAPGSRFVFVPASGGAVPLTLRSEAPRADTVGHVVWFDLPAGTEVAPAVGGRVRVLAPEGALTVPSQALGWRESKAFVAVRRGGAGASAVVTVEVLRTAGPQALVRGPIAAGDTVAEDPYAATEAP